MKLKDLRTERGLTQSELGKILKISPSTIGMYEQKRREPDLKTLTRIADYFGVSTDYLLGRSEVIITQVENEENHKINEKIMNLAKEGFADKIADLTEEQKDKVLEYIDFLKSKNNKKN